MLQCPDIRKLLGEKPINFDNYKTIDIRDIPVGELAKEE